MSVVQAVANHSANHLLRGLRKRHANECRTQCLGVHFHAGATQIIILPGLVRHSLRAPGILQQPTSTHLFILNQQMLYK